MLDSLQQAKKVIGIKQTKKALSQDEVNTLYLAEDADARLIKQLKDIAEEKGVKIVSTGSMKELGKACGIDVSAAAAAVLK